jgi:hypothetical protein
MFRFERGRLPARADGRAGRDGRHPGFRRDRGGRWLARSWPAWRPRCNGVRCVNTAAMARRCTSRFICMVDSTPRRPPSAAASAWPGAWAAGCCSISAADRPGRGRGAQAARGARVAQHLRSAYAGELDLTEVLAPEQVRRFARRATGEKFLIRPC